MARPQQMSAMWILGLMFAALTASAYAQSTNTLDTTTFDEAFNVLYGADNQIERSMDGRAVSLSMTELTGNVHSNRGAGMVIFAPSLSLDVVVTNFTYPTLLYFSGCVFGHLRR